MLTGAAVAALFVLLALAARCDLASRRIPNRLTLAGGAAGLLLAASQGGWGALGEAALGGLAGLGVLLPVWLLGGMGAGDVKLLGAAGTFLGVPLVFWGATCSAVAGSGFAAASSGWAACGSPLLPAPVPGLRRPRPPLLPLRRWR